MDLIRTPKTSREPHLSVVTHPFDSFSEATPFPASPPRNDIDVLPQEPTRPTPPATTNPLSRYWHKQVYNYNNPDSVVVSWRRRRAEELMERLLAIPYTGRPLDVLDVGGLHQYWSMIGIPDPERFHITLLNLDRTPLPDVAPGFSSIAGDGRCMKFQDQAFDLVFSNSVIEHLPTRFEQEQFAAEIARVGKRFAVQTPSKWFPVEVHSCIPMFQFMPVRTRTALMERFEISWYPSGETNEETREVAQSIRLLSAAGMRRLFPKAELSTEKLMGFTKSYTAYGGNW